MKYLILLFFFTSPVLASDKLTVETWPKKQSCNHCVSIQAYGLKMTLASTVKSIAMLPTLGLNIETKNKKFFISTPPESSLPTIKEKLKVDSWIQYHELLAIKSNDKKIEGLRKALEITMAKGYYKYTNKEYTVFFIDRPNAPLGTSSEIMIIPTDESKVVKIGGKFTKTDVVLILSNLKSVNLY